MKPTFSILSAAIGVFLVTAPALADYTLILQNGRRITVQSYREDAGMIKFYGLGGEVGISKDQIQAIRKADEREPAGMSVVQPQPAPAPGAKEPTAEAKKLSPPTTTEKQPSAEETLDNQRAKEEKEYQQKIKEITEQLRELRDRYAAATRGNVGPEPSFFTTEEAFRGHQEDLLSRLRDAQYKAQGLETGFGAKSPPFSLDPPPAYTEKQKNLSDLRNQINRLESDRQRLIEEMQQKGFDTGALFLE